MTAADVDGCLACDLASGREPLPGGAIYETPTWRIEHCLGPLGLGTFIVKPVRHVTNVADLTAAEAAEMGPLLREAARVTKALTDADQVYICLWSHAGGEPGHIHYVVQPVNAEARAKHGDKYGPALQMAMFEAGDFPTHDAIESFTTKARSAF